MIGDEVNKNEDSGYDVFRGNGVEVILKSEDDFLKIKETLTRIGVSSNTSKTLYQSCHIYHKRDRNGKSRYAIVHFKEMFKFDGRPSSLSETDIGRRNVIVKLLKEWGLIDVVGISNVDELTPMLTPSSIKIISHQNKKDWNLVSKYTIGQKK